MESRVLPNPEVSAILASKFVCVKLNIDSPGADADKILSQVKGNTLPFYAYVTPEGKFVNGTSGFRDVKDFKADLEGVLKSELLRVPAEVEKKLVKIAEQAAKDFEAKKIAGIVKAAKDVEAIRGYSESKNKIKDLFSQVIESGMQKIKEAAELCKEGKFEEAGAIIRALMKDYKGTDVEPAATAANKALDRVKTAAKEIEKGGKVAAKRLYELVVKECKDAPPFVELAEAKLKELVQ